MLLQVNKLVREIEVSHWGNIYVEESYEIVSDTATAAVKHQLRKFAMAPRAAHNTVVGPAAQHITAWCVLDFRMCISAAEAALQLHTDCMLAANTSCCQHLCAVVTCAPCLPQQNAGSEHKGKFSRLTYFYSPSGKANSFPVSTCTSCGCAHLFAVQNGVQVSTTQANSTC